MSGFFEQRIPKGAAAPRRRGLRLRFPDELEREFRASPREAGRRLLRTAILVLWGLLIAAGVLSVLAVDDVAPRVAHYQWIIVSCGLALAAASCFALEHAHRAAFLDRKRLTEVAMHDGLTGLLNRAALEAQVRQLWQQAVRDRLPVSVVLADIDHFKAYNDCYGHQAGDQCLRDVAATIRRVARRRPLDLVARYGGEELIAVLFGADRSHAEYVARTVREAVAELVIPHVGSTTRPHVTVSVGAATLEPANQYSYDDAVQLADRALYEAKGRGRDGWAFHDAIHLQSDAVFRTGELFQSDEESDEEKVQLAS